VDIVLEFLMKALSLHTSSVQIEIFRALATVVYCNAGRVYKVSLNYTVDEVSVETLFRIIQAKKMKFSCQNMFLLHASQIINVKWHESAVRD
jgi:hypothetical protein